MSSFVIDYHIEDVSVEDISVLEVNDFYGNVITGEEVEAFTYGDCWRLALAVNELMGFPVAFFASVVPGVKGIETVNKRTQWCHVFNVLPDGRYIDVSGVYTDCEMYSKWIVNIWDERGREPRVIVPSRIGVGRMLRKAKSFYPEVNPFITAGKIASFFNVFLTRKREIFHEISYDFIEVFFIVLGVSRGKERLKRFSLKFFECFLF